MPPIRVIPCLDMRNGRVVKGVRFVNLVDAGDPVECARAYCKAGADEIAFLDINATFEGRKTMVEVARRTAEVATVPFTVGGGIRSCDDIETLFDAGVDNVSISSAAFRDPGFVREACKQFGSQRIIVAIDADLNQAMPSGYEVYIDGGRTATGRDAVEFAREMEQAGAGQILPTSRRTDGTKDGYDIPLTRGIAEAVKLPVIASGGAGKLEHFYEAVVKARAQAVLAASVFHFGIIAIADVKRYLRERGIPVTG
jgi:cyclase